MMDLDIFCGFIANAMHVDVVHVDLNGDVLKEFEESNCFHSSLQPMYTKQYLQLLFSNMKEYTFYEIVDYLETNLLLFQFQNMQFIVGPYVKKPFQEAEIQEMMIAQNIPGNVFLPLKLYYGRFPLIDYNNLTDMILASIRTFYPAVQDFYHRSLRGFHETLKLEEISQKSDRSYMEVLRRYERENKFLDKIRSGDVEGVLRSFDSLSTNFYKHSTNQKDIYSYSGEGLAVARTLVRKAAEEGGCSVLKIDEITQDAIHKIQQAKKTSEKTEISRQMILDLTEAVAEAKGLQKYPRMIRNLVSHLNSNYASEFSLTNVALEIGISQEHLSREFKKATGFTITEYIMIKRAEKAADLLVTTQLSIADIAYFVGYQDANYFVKIFKKKYDMTPSEYRRCH